MTEAMTSPAEKNTTPTLVPLQEGLLNLLSDAATKRFFSNTPEDKKDEFKKRVDTILYGEDQAIRNSLLAGLQARDLRYSKPKEGKFRVWLVFPYPSGGANGIASEPENAIDLLIKEGERVLDSPKSIDNLQDFYTGMIGSYENHQSSAVGKTALQQS